MRKRLNRSGLRCHRRSRNINETEPVQALPGAIVQRSSCSCGGGCSRCRANHIAAETTGLSPQASTDAAQKIDALKKKVYTCPPSSNTLTGIAKLTGTQGLLGHTKIDSASKLICAADFVPDKSKGVCTVKAKPVSLTINSSFTQKGLQNTGLSGAPKECPSKMVPIKFDVTQAISNLAKAAEQEHCDDITLAFNRTIKPCSTALQAMNGKTVPGTDSNSCHASLVSALGFDPIDCTLEFIKLSRKTDERDSKDWHTWDPVRRSGSCTEIIYDLKKHKDNKIGDPSVAPAKHIPAASKCSKPKAPAPSPTPVPKPNPGTNPGPAPKNEAPPPDK